jgi:glycosyltransferase involved in cell wall biosynthesis
LEKNNLPLVSVAIVTYNQKELLRECIESCLCQDYKDFEIIVADDGSTDGTHEMLLGYRSKYPSIFKLILSTVNKGITANSNSAHFSCSGKYIAWMGGDDLMMPGKLTKQVEFMERNPNCSISYHDHIVFDGFSGKDLFVSSEKTKPREGGLEVLVRYGCFNGGPSTMVRRSSTPINGFDSRLIFSSDWLYWIQTLEGGGDILHIKDILGKYRVQGNNITKKNKNLSQANIDKLNTCGILLSKRPDLTRDILNQYAISIRESRKQLNYKDALLFVVGASRDVKSVGALIVFYLSFGLIRL